MTEESELRCPSPELGGRGAMKYQERWREPKTPKRTKRTRAEKKYQV